MPFFILFYSFVSKTIKNGNIRRNTGIGKAQECAEEASLTSIIRKSK
jgi:hypothetical protein